MPEPTKSHELALNDAQADSHASPELKPKANILQILFPIVVTLGIFWWIFSGIDFANLKQATAGIAWLELSLVIATFCVWLLFLDTFSFGAAFKFLLARQSPWSHMLLLRGGTIFSGVIFPPLGEVFAPYYFFRKWQQSVLRTIGTSFYVVLIDSSCGALALACAFLFFDTSMLSNYWLLLLLGHGSLLLTFSLAFSRFGLPYVPEKIKSREFFYAMRTVSLRFTLSILLVRLCVLGGVFMTIYYLLQATGINIGFAQALLFIPLFMASVFLPISAGGYGGPQGAAVLFLVQLWELCSTEEALAFSLLWSTFFLIGRAVVTGPCVLPLWLLLKNLKPEVEDSKTT